MPPFGCSYTDLSDGEQAGTLPELYIVLHAALWPSSCPKHTGYHGETAGGLFVWSNKCKKICFRSRKKMTKKRLRSASVVFFGLLVNRN